jgi:predicted negative regulator of RcsB-dependent stress response
MKTTERHHLKDNELAIALNQAQDWAGKNSRTLTTTVGAIIVVAVAVFAFMAWRGSSDNKARAALAAAMVIEEARVMPPQAPAGMTNDPNAVGGQLPGTYPTEKAKLEAAVPKFQAAADGYPSTDSGLTARFHLARTLVALGRVDEGLKEYDKVIAGGNQMLSRSAKLGKADAQIRAGQYDAAIATLKQMVDAKEPGLPAEAMLMELARAYKLAGKTEDARKTLTQVVEQHGDSPYATEARAEIDKLKAS